MHRYSDIQWIKDKIARTLKVLQKRYITTDTAVTSEDLEANLLCCALEAVFIHGIKSKFIRSDGGHVRKGGSRGALPQPVFWSLLKTVTHRDVVQELERLSFINSDIGRCRAWVRLALNDGLLECYLASLFREGSNLGSYYQPGALLLDPEDREVLLTLLQGLSSMTFQLSYKSAVLNEWTNTPLVLAGLCPPTPADEHLVVPKRKESWDTVSQSSGGSGSSDWAQEVLQREPRREQLNTPLTTSNLSLDTSGSSQLSSSLSSDSLLQGQELRSPEKEHWSCDTEIRFCMQSFYLYVVNLTVFPSLHLFVSQKSTSWISEDDFYKPEKMDSPEAYAVIDIAQMNGRESPTSEPAGIQSAPSVVHRRHNGKDTRRGLSLSLSLSFSLSLSLSLSLFLSLSLSLFLSLSLSLSLSVSLSLSMMRDEQWDVLHTSHDQDVPSPTPSSPEHIISELPDTPQLDWTRHKDPEPDAIKEAVVYQNLEEKGWRSVLLSLSLETLRGYQVQGDSKTPLFIYPIGSIRDVVPDVSLGSPAFFKVLTVRDTLTLRAESGEEARGWRSLIRGALDSYLETEDDGAVQGESAVGSVHKLVQHRLKGDGVLLSHLSTVPNERGLDAQNYKCAGCPRQIGMSLGRARLCAFSGQYYCESCHQGDTTIIPSRMLHNWDLTAREVSKQAFKLLTQIEHEPLLHLDVLNPDLFDHTDIMERVQSLRLRLRFLGDYILICRSSISKQIQPRLQQRTFLLDNSDLYSVLDLQQIADGHYESYLQSLIQFGSKHVHSCDLCTQRGFICQICNSDNIIFPFQFDSTIRCEVCKTVFHSSCKAKCPVCPRCVRIQKYMERDLED
uniref:Pleckstrin homology domain containing, family M (with RUN domain) member 1 n=1 Tax=Cyprinus carpio TaxID=7962 RepID=A0A8C1IE08_CYPCA